MMYDNDLRSKMSYLSLCKMVDMTPMADDLDIFSVLVKVMIIVPHS